REPPQVEPATGVARSDESRLRMAHLRRHALHPPIFAVVEHDGRGVAAEGLRGEGVDDEDRQAHPEMLPRPTPTPPNFLPTVGTISVRHTSVFLRTVGWVSARHASFFHQ